MKRNCLNYLYLFFSFCQNEIVVVLQMDALNFLIGYMITGCLSVNASNKWLTATTTTEQSDFSVRDKRRQL